MTDNIQQKNTILVLDNSIEQELYNILDNYNIIYMKSVQDVISEVLQEKIDLIIVNEFLDNNTGYDAVGLLKSDSHIKNIPIIFVLNDLNVNNIEKLYSVGSDEYVIKPFNSYEINLKIQTQLDLKSNSRSDLQYIIDTKTDLINKLLDVGIALTSETNFDLLMEKLVVGTKEFSNADACTIYLLSDDKKSLEFTVVRTDMLSIKMGGTGEKISWPPLQLYQENGMPNDSMVAVKSALEKKLFNFDDVYEVDEFNFDGTKAFDASTFYRTKSMIVVPMLNTNKEVIGVIQLINKLNDNGEIISFGENDEILLSSMSSLGGVAVHNHKLVDNLQELLDSLETKVQERTKDLELAKKQIEAIHKHTRDSIEYASLIQGALIPQKGAMSPFFKDHFVTWTPKDTVGGDIWLFDELRHKDECLLFFIDCTGHGVPGAFVTMIVKAIEREILLKLRKHPEFDISPAIIMGYFNRTMKTLLRQETKDSLSNAGWDGGIIYYNKKTQILKFAGAETPLFYITKDGEFHTIKGNRYSVGYKKCDMNYEYKETVLNVESGMKFYCTTDGYLDQNGGEKDFPFGKKRFSNIIKEYYKEPMVEIEAIFQIEMMEYESMIENNDRNDDITLIGFEIK